VYDEFVPNDEFTPEQIPRRGRGRVKKITVQPEP
jgi:hypothetical protein